MLDETKIQGSKIDVSAVQDEGLKNQMMSLGKDVDVHMEIQKKPDLAKKDYEDKYNAYLDAKSSRLDAEISYNQAMQELNAYLTGQTQTDVVKTSVQTNAGLVNTGIETNAFVPMMTSMLAALGVIGVMNKKRKED